METTLVMQMGGIIFLFLGTIVLFCGNLSGGLGMLFIGAANICFGWR